MSPPDPPTAAVATAHLLGINRPDLAAHVGQNRKGNPMWTKDGGIPALGDQDQELVLEAFLIAHKSKHENAYLSEDTRGTKGIFCVTCQNNDPMRRN